MIAKRTSKSAWVSFRLLVALTLCFAGLSLAVTASASWQGLAMALRVKSSPKQLSLAEKMKAKARKSGRASEEETKPPRSMAGKINAPSGPRVLGPAGWPRFNGAQPTVTQQTNAIGQTVYSIAPSNFALSYELYGIAAAVLGGCSLRGGEGSVLGIVLGTVLLQVLQNLVNLLGIKSTLEMVVMGVVILIGVIIDQVLNRRARKTR